MKSVKMRNIEQSIKKKYRQNHDQKKTKNFLLFNY